MAEPQELDPSMQRRRPRRAGLQTTVVEADLDISY
jgi:hypothetical protein